MMNSTRGRCLRSVLVSVAVAGLISTTATTAGANPFAAGYGKSEIPGTNTSPTVIGSSWTPKPVPPPVVPQHPYLAANGKSNIHVDAYQTDASTFPGPNGRGAKVKTVNLGGQSGTITQDSYGHLVTSVITPTHSIIVVMDKMMNVLSTYDLPVVNRLGADGEISISGGGYFYLDNKNRAMVPSLDGRIYAVQVHANGRSSLARAVDLSDHLRGGDHIHSALPDWDGRVWFTTDQGRVGAISDFFGTARVQTTALGETIKKSFASDSDGSMSIVTDDAMYRMAAGADGRPAVEWRTPYPNDGVRKPGKLSAGAGSTPTLIEDSWVATTDNADPTNVVVYRRGPKSEGGGKEVCRVPVFPKGASADFQSLTYADGQILAENNYGYSGLLAVAGGRTTVPGLAAISFDTNAERCSVKWVNNTVSSPSAIPRLSLANGLVYTATKPHRSNGADEWYLTAVDWRTGRTVYEVKYGSGPLLNNNFAGFNLTPDGAAYMGVVSGMVRIDDAH